MKGYGQFCPVAKATEIFGERWTPLIIRELLAGSRHFNALRRGLPLISPSLLARRLRSLERAGVVTRSDDGKRTIYALTPAGRELQPMIESLGVWGQRWARSHLQAEDLDAGLLMWDIRRNIDPGKLPPGRAVVLFAFTDLAGADAAYWLVVDHEAVDLCIENPGFDVDLVVSSDVRTFTELWMGDLSVGDALAADRMVLEGSRRLRDSFRRWFTLSPFAGVARPGRAGGQGGAQSGIQGDAPNP